MVAGLFLLLSIEAGTFVDIPTNVLGLIGISSASYLGLQGRAIVQYAVPLMAEQRARRKSTDARSSL